MELRGKIIAEFNERGGISNRTGNEWKAKSYVIEVPGEYPRKMVFDVFGAERLQRFNIQVGQTVLVAFDIDAREYNGRWYNSIRAFDVRQVDATQPVAAQASDAVPVSAPQAVGAAPVAAPAEEEVADSPDNLPF